MLEDFLINAQLISPHSLNPPRAKDKGQNVMRASTVTFIGITRDQEREMPNVLLQIEHLAKQFKTSRAIFVEAQSNDKTAALLTKWAASSPNNRTAIVHYFNSSWDQEQEGFFKGHKMPREGRIALTRNGALESLRNETNKTDYVIVVDLDIVGFDIDGVADSFAHRDNLAWDVVCANGHTPSHTSSTTRPLNPSITPTFFSYTLSLTYSPTGIMLHGTYRDTYALRSDTWNNTNAHLWNHEPLDMYNFTIADKEQHKSDFERNLRSVRNTMDFAASKAGLIRVHSCFGGLSIYKYELFRDCEYQYRHTTHPFMVDCEHILLHQCMTQKHGAKIFVNPGMKLWYGHTKLYYTETTLLSSD